jgi:hypothetical protein
MRGLRGREVDKGTEGGRGVRGMRRREVDKGTEREGVG